MEILAKGNGALFTNPSANVARTFFARKPRSLTSKLSTVSEAVRRLIHDGDYLAAGGFGGVRISTAVLHEILRQGLQNLRFAGSTATHTFQLLCAGNLMTGRKTLAAVDAAYIVGLEARGLSPHARRVMESGEVSCTEWSNFTLALRFKAAAMGIPFLPARTLLGTDTFAHSAAIQISCPFTGEPLVAVPALYPDVAAIHVHECDVYGNCRIKGVSVADLDMARAAKRLIVTCERLISTDEIRSEPTRTVIPFFCVDAVCEVPYGSFPGNMPGEYFSDEEHLGLWLEVEKDLEKFKRFLDDNIYGIKSFQDYLMRNGGNARMKRLRQQELLVDAESERLATRPSAGDSDIPPGDS
jgi:glutaconate CoA-transferase subunit A